MLGHSLQYHSKGSNQILLCQIEIRTIKATIIYEAFTNFQAFESTFVCIAFESKNIKYPMLYGIKKDDKSLNILNKCFQHLTFEVLVRSVSVIFSSKFCDGSAYKIQDNFGKI